MPRAVEIGTDEWGYTYYRIRCAWCREYFESGYDYARYCCASHRQLAYAARKKLKAIQGRGDKRKGA